MLPISRVIVSLVYFNSLVRDSLEYTIRREKFDVNYYEYKKNGIINEPKLNTPLKYFLDNNGEKGAELKKMIEDFGNELYGDNSTILRVEGDTVKVDANQVVRIFDLAIPLHEQLNAVIRLHDTYRKEHNEVEDKITELLELDEKFYRAVALFSLSGTIMAKFREFNDLMRESNGEKGPAAKFVENELNTLVRCFSIVKQNASCKSSDYLEPLDALDHLIEMMNGRRDLPQGQNFNQVYADVNQKIQKFLIITEDAWKKSYTPLIQEMIKDNQELRAKAEANQEGSANATAEALVEENKGE